MRPQAVRLRGGGPRANELAGTVRKAAYLGGHMEYEVTLDGVPRDVLAVDTDVAHPLHPGAAVAASIAPGDATIVPAE